MQQEIVEVDGVRLQQAFLVLGIDAGDDRLQVISDRVAEAACNRFGGVQVVLLVADAGGDQSRRERDRVDVLIVENLLDELLLIAGVENRVVRLQPDGGRPAAQQPGAEPVKGADPEAFSGQQAPNALGHFVGRFVGEGDRQNVPGIDSAIDHSGDAVRDHPGLAGTRAGKNQQRPVNVLDGLALRDRELSRQTHRGSSHRTNPFQAEDLVSSPS